MVKDEDVGGRCLVAEASIAWPSGIQTSFILAPSPNPSLLGGYLSSAQLPRQYKYAKLWFLLFIGWTKPNLCTLFFNTRFSRCTKGVNTHTHTHVRECTPTNPISSREMQTYSSLDKVVVKAKSKFFQLSSVILQRENVSAFVGWGKAFRTAFETSTQCNPFQTTSTARHSSSYATSGKCHSFVFLSKHFKWEEGRGENWENRGGFSKRSQNIRKMPNNS